MRTPVRGAFVALCVGAAVLVGGGSALAATQDAMTREDDGVAVVDEPDTDDLHDQWTFSPLGVPVFGLIDSVAEVPGQLLPGS
ncbi:hypothetical protein IQ251_12990 [Saccharopolyspora sp. HNM0983]|uniref:Uncharacterized protein n=1 Tax=Saccharopolyspora montiporae TaxID=2781240 RepID=A0A929B8T5_9PSEU|nr:hypothetical protein [Saccharopolyspora sp. HNM0983]MBE9375362.1 hypothetical protein [Saccharopolyspora sp. HNM0983]